MATRKPKRWLQVRSFASFARSNPDHRVSRRDPAGQRRAVRDNRIEVDME